MDISKAISASVFLPCKIKGKKLPETMLREIAKRSNFKSQCKSPDLKLQSAPQYRNLLRIGFEIAADIAAMSDLCRRDLKSDASFSLTVEVFSLTVHLFYLW